MYEPPAHAANDREAHGAFGTSFGAGEAQESDTGAQSRPTADAAATLRSAPLRRALAWLIDYALVIAVAVLLGILTFHRVEALATDVPGLTERGAWQIVRSRGDLGASASGLGNSLWHSVVTDVQQAFGALVLFAFCYRFATLAWLGRTLGQAAAGLRVVPHRASAAPRPTRRSAAVRAAVTTCCDVACYSLACCLLVDGSLVLSFLCWALAVLLFWANALPALAGSGRSLADRAAGTRVLRVGVLRAATTVAIAGGRYAGRLARQAAGSPLGRATAQRARATLTRARPAESAELTSGSGEHPTQPRP
ncbi:RDD family protein [Streptomyces hoynatensis]|uniref:RDD domain-containing protein n=1 Tax=Streptomyces hoynatensis TaxID=1141874 RepID=A0A3A9Z2K2_9ACTN|nr:RDD family protein [Streptomyces hoynatensis]RKN41646.1 hypothetical protein D7294_14240 [Streptomyces hoynatensis]